MSIAMGTLRSDEALGHVPVTQPTLARLAQVRVTHRWSLAGRIAALAGALLCGLG